MDRSQRTEEDRDFGFDTRQVHAGQRPDPNTGARAVPIYQTTSYVFEDPESAAAYFNLQEYGNTYSRIMNPTVAVFEERMASLEGGCGAVAFASGLAAQVAALFTLLQPGDHVVSSSALYGGTVNQFKHVLRKMNVGLTWVNPDDPAAWQAAVPRQHEGFFAETIGNPGGNVLDIEAVAAIAHAHEIPLLVDNTFASPYLCRPFEWGADIVIHSATKFIGGHGTSIGGVVVDSGAFNWSNGRFPVVAEPSPAYHGLEFHETFGTYGYLMKLRAETLRDLGAAMSPFNAFLFLQGLETLSLRMERHVQNATAVANYLDGHALASRVTYPGLAGSPYRALVDKYLPRGAGAVFSFECHGGRAGGQEFIRAVTLWSHLANVGDAKSLIIHPASTTHRQLNDDELRAAGVGPGTIRLSCGNRIDRRPDLGSGAGLCARGRRECQRSHRMSPAGTAFDLARYQDPQTIQRMVHNAKTVAIVGLSKNELRASHFVGYYLRRHGFRVIPVNPREPEIFGEKSYASLLDLPVPVDIVNVFRAPEALPGIAAEAVKIRAGALWCQFGVINEEGARIAEAGNVPVIMDRCLKVEHARYVGRMHWLGLNTRRITSVRGGLE
jgi:O-acetylhomoserine (thiol)-lyase